MDLSEIRSMISKGMTLEDIAEHMTWQSFEDLCVSIMEENGYDVQKHLRFKHEGSRHEIDILATKNLVRKHGRGATRTTRHIAIDCKHWSVGRTSALRAASKKQQERVKTLKKTQNFKRKSITSAIVTLFQENIAKEKETWIIPVFKLNSFLFDL